MKPTDKAVLMCMADLAHDDGVLWHSIETLVEYTCFSRRAVIDAIKALELAGFLTVERGQGRSNHYTVIAKDLSKPVQMAHRCISRTRAADAPKPVQMAHPPVQMAPKPVHLLHPKHKKHKESISRSINTPDKPVDVSDQVWEDFKVLRKSKKAALTETAIEGIRREALKAGISLEDAMATCCERGWQGFKADWMASRAAPSETAYQRSMREKMEVFAPSVAARPPGMKSGQTIDLNIFENPALLERA